MSINNLISVKDLAKILNVPKSWIYQRTRMGPSAIPHVKIGKYVRFNPDEVVEFYKTFTTHNN